MITLLATLLGALAVDGQRPRAQELRGRLGLREEPVLSPQERTLAKIKAQYPKGHLMLGHMGVLRSPYWHDPVGRRGLAWVARALHVHGVPMDKETLEIELRLDTFNQLFDAERVSNSLFNDSLDPDADDFDPDRMDEVVAAIESEASYCWDQAEEINETRDREHSEHEARHLDKLLDQRNIADLGAKIATGDQLCFEAYEWRYDRPLTPPYIQIRTASIVGSRSFGPDWWRHQSLEPQTLEMTIWPEVTERGKAWIEERLASGMDLDALFEMFHDTMDKLEEEGEDWRPWGWLDEDFTVIESVTDLLATLIKGIQRWKNGFHTMRLAMREILDWYRGRVAQGDTPGPDEDLDTFLQQMCEDTKNRVVADMVEHFTGDSVKLGGPVEIRDDDVVIARFKDGAVIVDIRDRQSLRDEGSSMNHCVGQDQHGHPVRIMGGSSKAFSYRNPKGVPRATWEVDRNSLQTIDFQGPRNSHIPDADAIDRMRWWVHQVREPRHWEPVFSVEPERRLMHWHKGPYDKLITQSLADAKADLVDLPSSAEGCPKPDA